MRKDSTLPTDIAIRNVGTEPITFKYYGVSFVKTLAPDEEVVISGASSEATGYYLALLDGVKGLDIKVNATDGGDDTPDDPDEPTEDTNYNVRIGGISSESGDKVNLTRGNITNVDTGDRYDFPDIEDGELVFMDIPGGSNYYGEFEAYGCKGWDGSIIIDSNNLSISFEPRIEEFALKDGGYALANTINIYDSNDNPVTVERDPGGMMYYVARLNDGETYHLVATKEGYENIDEFFTIDYSRPVRHNYNWVKAPVVPTTFQVAVSFEDSGEPIVVDSAVLDDMQPDFVSDKSGVYVYMWNNVGNGEHIIYSTKQGYYDNSIQITVNGTNYSSVISMAEESENPEEPEERYYTFKLVFNSEYDCNGTFVNMDGNVSILLIN